MNILVATEDLTFSVSLSQAYKAAGHSVSAGLPELYLGLRTFDLIHFHWPEELTGWEVPPVAAVTQKLLARIDALKVNATMVCTVHNLLPHADVTGAMWGLYNAFYARMDCIGHFSETSRSAVQARFPEIPPEKHIIHGMQDFANLRQYGQGRERARAQLDAPQDACIVGAIGQLRTLSELSLLVKTVDGCDVPNFHLLRACRLPPTSAFADRVRRRLLRNALGRRPSTQLSGFVDDVLLVAICEASDMIFIPRHQNQLNSGVLPLAMTFGTGIIAPDAGVFREMLAGSMNELYAPGDATAASAAVARLAAKPPEAVRAANLALASDWGWTRGVAHILAALPQ